MPRSLSHALAVLLLLLVGCSANDDRQGTALQAAHAESKGPLPAASTPTDPDLQLGQTCRGHGSADTLRDHLPTYVKELVVMWPRVGRSKDSEGRCRTVCRLTALNHQGVPITISFILHGKDERPQGQDYRLLDTATPPRAVMDMVASDEYPHVLVEAAGAPSTSRDALEGILEFLHPERVVAQLLDGR